MTRNLPVAVVQLSSSLEPEDNFPRIAVILKESSGSGARLVVLPENCLCHGPLEAIRGQARSLKGWHADFFSRLEKSKLDGTAVIWGGIPERSGSRIFDTAVVTSAKGEILGVYRKNHLFSYSDPEVEDSVCEADIYSPCSKGLCFSLRRWRVGLSICFDLRFPEHYARYGHPEILVCSAAFTQKTGEAHWEHLTRARAIENQCYFLAANQHGTAMAHCPATYGHSMIVDPWGAVLSRIPAGEKTIFHTLEAGMVEKVRKTIRIDGIFEAKKPYSKKK